MNMGSFEAGEGLMVVAAESWAGVDGRLHSQRLLATLPVAASHSSSCSAREQQPAGPTALVWWAPTGGGRSVVMPRRC